MNHSPDYWPTLNWQTAEPLHMGLNPAKLQELDTALTTRYKSINGLLITRQGYTVFERYNNGFGPDNPQNVASVTKTILSALVGIAIDAGYIQNVEQKVLDFFPEFTPAPGEIQKKAITIRHLLTMTAPFAWQSTAKGYEPLDRLRRQKNWVEFILKILGERGQIGKFQYSSVGTHLLSAILTRTTGKSARAFANENLFRPLGMREIPEPDMGTFSLDDVFGKNVKGWINDPQGYTTGGWGLTITPRDMARFAYLYLNNGYWDGKQIISQEWVKNSPSEQAKNYGKLWWLRESGSEFTYFAAGYGGSYIYCTPAKDLLVVIASKMSPKPLDRWPLMEEFIFPAVEEK